MEPVDHQPLARSGPNLLASVWGRRIAFFLLYITEGIPIGFTAVAVATQMRREGVGPAAIGTFVATLYLPWAWKWAFGPVVDLVSSDRLGRRRAWIVACQIIMALTLLMAWPIDFSTRLALFTWIILLHNVFAAIQDVAIDALAVDTLPKEERGVVNGLMFAGAYLGQAVGGAGVLFLSSAIGFSATFPFVCGSIVLVTVGVAIWLREPIRAARAPSDEPALERVAAEVATYLVTAVKAIFGTRRSVAGLVFALLPAGAYALSLALQSNLAVELGLDDDRIAWLNLFSTIMAATGCVLGGWISDKIGRRLSTAIYVVLTLVPTVALALYMRSEGWIMPVDMELASRPTPSGALVGFFWAACIVYSLFQGLIYGSRTALFMDLSNPAVGATQFTAYMALMNVVISYTAWWQGHAIERYGYPATLLMDAGFGLVCLAVLPLMSAPRAIEAEPADPPTTAFDGVSSA